MKLLKNNIVEIHRIQNQSNRSCSRCGKIPSYRYDYRFFVGWLWYWTRSRCQLCLQKDLFEFDIGITQIKKRLPDLTRIPWKSHPVGWQRTSAHELIS